MDATKIIQTFYISTGRKQGFYTLRYRRDVVGSPHLSPYTPDNHICTLAATEEKAVEKAQAYFDAFVERVGGSTEERVLVFEPYADHDVIARRGVLSVSDTLAMEAIEAGILPFGKHKGVRFEDAPESYLLYFADKLHSDDEAKPVSAALYAACAGAALELGYIAKRDAARAERAALDALSTHIGAVGERRNFSGVVVTQFFKKNFEDSPPDDGYYINKIRVGADLVVYVGNKLGEKDAPVEFKATIKAHDEYKGVKTTKVNRPTMKKAGE